MKVGKKIKLLRENKNLTRQELAEKIQVTPVTISRYENSTREPNIETLKKISNILNVNISELLINNDEEVSNEKSEKKGVFSKFNDKIDKIQLKREMDKLEAINPFFELLGYKIIWPTNEDYSISINDVEYTPCQFETLLKMLETCIENTQNLLRNSEN
ncbi:helix-turn-helix transcriptional regulator [Clostridium sp. ZBS14]|uniref:helix-turn-helix domain-containing protein n=1 Tax=Clostridium sp. ZBS14 TaxID=2949970 RepID=UPI0020795C7F|nr:helix-turn-helix transcriptional regulator [Clostridium sp. ZBS14]